MCLRPIGSDLHCRKGSHDGLGRRIRWTSENYRTHPSNVSHAATVAEAQRVPPTTGSVGQVAYSEGRPIG